MHDFIFTSQPRHYTRTKSLDQHISIFGKFPKKVLPLSMLQINGNASFISIQKAEGRTPPFITILRNFDCFDRAARRFDL